MSFDLKQELSKDISQHSDECQNVQRAWLQEYLLYQESYPDYCHDCEGWGYSMEQGLVSYAKFCHCLNSGKCPRCGQNSVDRELNCAACGWRYMYPGVDGIPLKPDCICKEHKHERA